MGLLDDFRDDVRLGMKREQIRKEEEAKKKRLMKIPKKPRVANRHLMTIGIWVEKTRPIWPLFNGIKRFFSELTSYAKRDLGKVYERTKRRPPATGPGNPQ